MNSINTVRNFHLLAICLTAITFAACGQPEQADQAAPDAVDENAAAEAAVSVKIPTTTSSAEALELFTQGRALADDLQNVRANALFAQAVEEDPEFAMGYLMLANTSQTTADFFAAIEMAKTKMGNASPGEQFMISALVAVSENDQAAQLEAIKGAMKLHPQDERTHMALGNYHNGQQNFPEAVKHFGHATTINPDFAGAFNSLGYAHRSNDNLDGAKQAFERYVQLIPDEANPYDSYAELLMEMGEYDESIANYRMAIAIDRRFASAYAGISINESLKGEAEAAQEAAAQMLAEARNDAEKRGAMFRSVTSSLFAGDVEAALAAAEEILALAEAEGNYSAMGGISEYMGDIVAVEGDGAKAAEYYDASLAHRQAADINDANKAQAARTHLFKSAIATMVAGNIDESSAFAAKYAAAVDASGTAFERRRVHEITGYLAASNDDNETCAAELAQANQLDPIVLYWSAVAHKSLGNTEKATDLATRAASRNTLSGNLPFFRDEALELLDELSSD